MPLAAGIHYYTYRESETTPVVLIHGAGGSHLSWSSQIRRMNGFRVYALDLPGHGKSSSAGQQTIPAYTRFILEWMRLVGLPRAIFVGHSMGGAIAQEISLNFPEQVIALGLIGTASRLPVNQQLLEETTSANNFQIAVEKIVSWSFDNSCPPRLKELVARRMAETRPSVLHDDLLACNSFDITARVPEITCPTLVLCGANDRMVPLRAMESLASLIPGAHFEVIPGAGHMVVLEKPQSVADALMGFFNGVRRQAF